MTQLRTGVASTPHVRVVSAAAEQAWNDAALEAPSPTPRLAFWTYSAPAVVLGAGQRRLREGLAGERASGIPFVCRSTGGGAVFAGPWLLATSLVLPAFADGSRFGTGQAFAILGDSHLAALTALGVSARFAGAGQRMQPEAAGAEWACFGATRAKEIVTLDRRKLVGLAQARRRTGTLVVAGLLLADPDWAAFCRVMGASDYDARELARRTSSCARMLKREPEAASVASAISAHIALVLGATCDGLRDAA